MNKVTLIKFIHFGLTHLCVILFYWFANDTTIPIEEYEEEKIVAYLRTTAEVTAAAQTPPMLFVPEYDNCKEN